MIGEDLDPWTKPALSMCYDGALDEQFLRGLGAEFEQWDAIRSTMAINEILADLGDGDTAQVAAGDDDLEVSIWAKQPGTGGRDRLGVLSANAFASDIDGPAWFDLVVGLYRRSVSAGRRPIYTVVARDSGKYVVRPFTEQSVLAGEIVELGWMHVFTPEQVDALGRERLVGAPATRTQKLDDGAIALALTLGDADEKATVAEHLGIHAPVGSDWFDDLDHEIDYVRHRAARRIRSLANREEIAAGPILGHLDEEDPIVRFKLTRALHYASDDDVEPALRELARSDDAEAVRSMAVHVLGEGDVVREALWDSSARVQHSALDELWKCPDEEALDRVVELLDSDYFQTRQKAAERITSDRFFEKLPDSAMQSARRALADRDDHQDGRIRRCALEAAELVQHENYADRLEAALGDESVSVRIAAAKRFPNLHDDVSPAIECLVDVVDEKSFYADDVAEVLVSLDPRRAFLELIPRLDQLEDSERRSVVRCLETEIERTDPPWVLDVLATLNLEERYAAASAIEDVGTDGGLRDLMIRSLECQ